SYANQSVTGVEEGRLLGSLYIYSGALGFWLLNTSDLQEVYPSGLLIGWSTDIVETPKLEFRLMTGFPDFPFFVVITMTPLAALAPKTAVELASFRMSIASLSTGLMSDNSPL